MRSKRLDLSEILKVGLSPKSGVHYGIARLKNMRSDGSNLVGCPTEIVEELASCIPFTRGGLDYYVTDQAIYKLSSGTPIFVAALSGHIKVVDLIDITWIQDSSQTLFVTAQGVSTINPSGNRIPVCNTITEMNGQILYGGVLDGTHNLGIRHIGWGDIGSDSVEIDKSNTAGFHHPNIGEIYNICPMEKSALVIGSYGISLMYYAEQTFGHKRLFGPRPFGKNLCASCPDFALFISSDGCIIKVAADGTITNLNFEWLGKDVVDVKYVKNRNWFIFTTADNSYILDHQGMFSFGYRVWGVFTDGLAAEAGFEQDTFEFETADMDFSKAGLKNITEVFVQDNLRSPAIRSVEVKTSGTANSQGWKRLNNLCATKYPIAGDTLKVGYRSDTNPKVHELIVEIQDHDRRFGYGYTPYSGGSR